MRQGEGPVKWHRRQTCSPQCASRLHAMNMLGETREPIPPHAPCANEVCGGPVRRRQNEPLAKWKIRRCCSAECARAVAVAAARRQKPEPTEDLAPVAEIDFRGAFYRHNIAPGDGWTTRYDTPATHVEREAAS
jgi:hypothetical protein